MEKKYELNSVVNMKKGHPCGENRWKITRIGVDIKLECTKCGRNIMMSRIDFEKKLKKVVE